MLIIRLSSSKKEKPLATQTKGISPKMEGVDKGKGKNGLESFDDGAADIM